VPSASDEAALSLIRAVSRDLVTRMARDPMIGFAFAGVDLARLAEGRPLEAAHFPRRIFGGQFDRRMVLLREILAEREVPAPLRDAWLAHAAAQRERVVARGAPDCA
jgi:truncated hemoglobin YjbI